MDRPFGQKRSLPAASPIRKEVMGHESASKEILRFWKTQWEAYMKAMAAMQEQGETMLEMIQQSGALQEGSQNMIQEWARSTRQSRKTYLDAVEDHSSRSSRTHQSRAFPEPGTSDKRWVRSCI
jgi:hypothetical protein